MKTQNKFIDFVSKQNYISELSIAEHIILWLNVALSLSFFIAQMVMFRDKQPYAQWTTWLTLISTIGSVFSVMAGAKQRIICPFIGIICSILLIAVAWGNQLPGSMIMYGFNMVMQTIVFIIWYRTSKNKITIQPTQLKLWFVIVYIIFFFGLTALFAWIEGIEAFSQFWFRADPMPLPIRIFDAMVLMFTIAACFPMLKKCDFVWWIYIICDTAIATTWALKATMVADENIFNAWSMFVSGLSMCATCVIGIVNWRRSLKNKA